MKNDKGITLIALVITIIVLIILAGISIRLLLGDNGIIRKAQDAGERYKVAVNEEEQKLSNVENAIDRIWQGLGLDDNPQGGGNPPVISIDTGPLGAPVNIENYGRLVRNYDAAGLKWRLFYEDSNNVYLISESQDGDYPVSNYYPLVSSSGSKYYAIDESYVSGESVSQQGKDLLPLLGGATSSSVGNIQIGTNSSGTNLLTSSNKNLNIFATAYLCDTRDDGPWTSYKTGVAAWAMGAPTIELYVASYNATHQGQSQITLGISGYGYTCSNLTQRFSTTENHGIYGINYLGAYWLIGPADYHWAYNLFLGTWQSEASISYNTAATSNYTIRPVVCLSKTNFTCDFIGNSENPEWELAVNGDKDSSGTISIGDLVQPKNSNLSSEKFYLIGINEDDDVKATLLAEKCIKTTSGNGQWKQQIGANADDVAFRAENNKQNSNIYAYSDIKEYVDTYVNQFINIGMTLENMDIQTKTDSIAAFHAVAKGRLMWEEEVNNLLNLSITNKSDIIYGPEDDKISYWLGTPFSNTQTWVRNIHGNIDGVCSNGSQELLKVRPVIEVKASLIN